MCISEYLYIILKSIIGILLVSDTSFILKKYVLRTSDLENLGIGNHNLFLSFNQSIITIALFVVCSGNLITCNTVYSNTGNAIQHNHWKCFNVPNKCLLNNKLKITDVKVVF